MAIIAKAQQRFNAVIGGSVSHLMNVYDDTGLPLDASEITGNHGSLTGLLSETIVGGKVQITVDASALAAGVYWYEGRASTNGGAAWTNFDGEIEAYAEDIETINIGAGATHPMTADLPSAGKTSLIINFGSSTSTLDGTGSNFTITEAALLGRVELNGPGICTRLGDAATDGIHIVSSGDGAFISDQIEFDQCGAIYYEHYSKFDGYVEFTSNIIKTNSVVPAGSGASGPDSLYQFTIKTNGNQQYPNTFDGNRIGKSWLFLDNASDLTIEDNVFQGNRAGVQAGDSIRWTYQRNYMDTKHVNTWSQVSGLTWTNPPDEFADNIFRGAQWQIRFGAGSVLDSVFADAWAENHIDASGHTSDALIDRNIFLPLTQTTATNYVGAIAVRGDNIKIRHNTVAGGAQPPFPFVVINEGFVLEEFVDNLVTGLEINRGVTGDAAVAPCSAGGIAQNISGSPLRPSSTPNRMTTATNNGWFDNASADADAYEDYGVGTVTGSPGTNDVNDDPEFVTGTYTFPSDGDIWALTDTVTEILTAIRAAFTLGASSPMRGAGTGGSHIGAVQAAVGGAPRYLLVAN